MPPQLSIIVTVHNKAASVKRCVNSVLAQTYKDYELILVDDGSTDSSGRICEGLARREGESGRVRLIRQERKGVTAARVVGTDSALGAYIHHVDADDWLEPDMESTLMKAIGDTGADIALTGYIDERSGLRCPAGSVSAGFYDREALERYIFPRMIAAYGEVTAGLHSALWAGLHRKGLTAPILRGIDPKLKRGEDGLCLYQAVSLASGVAVTEGAKYHYCPNPRSVTAKPLPEHYSNLERLMDGYLSSPMARIPPILRQFPNKFWYHVIDGDALAKESRYTYGERELECRERAVARIKALERALCASPGIQDGSE